MTALAKLITERWPEVVTFMLVFGRALGVIVAAPFWGGRAVPAVVRVWIALILAVATYPVAQVLSPNSVTTILALGLNLAGEVLLGLMLGWLAQLLFAGVRLAGQEIELRSGVGLLQLVDPQQGGHSGIFATFLEVSAGLVFFTLNGHHLLIQALSSSYAVFPLAGEKFVARLMAGLIGSAGEIFVIALRLSAPVLIGLLLSDIVLGVISRAVPHMNVFMVTQPVQFGFCVLLLMLSLPALVWFVARQLPQMVGVPGAVIN
jgi:flagellar biosynthetic protein FliR